MTVGTLMLTGSSSDPEPAEQSRPTPSTSTGARTGSTTSSSAASTPEAPPSEFADALLPAASFAADAEATPLSTENGSAGDPARPDGTVTPPECEQPEITYAEPVTVAQQQVTIPDSGVVFIQSVGSPYVGTAHDPALAAGLFGPCPTTTLTLPDGSQVVQTLTPLDLGDLGDANAGRRLAGEATNGAGQRGYSMFFFGDVVDGDRVVSLAMFAGGAAEPITDAVAADLETTFTALLADAYAYQHDVLG